jgi:acyl dehydratase
MSLFDPSRPTITIAQLQAKIGTETGVSRWFEISQARIDAFAEVTEDRQFIHVDPAAVKATPFGGTVAHGFLTMSMLSAIAYDALPRVEGLAMGVNYGFDKVRFVAPVRPGRIRDSGSPRGSLSTRRSRACRRSATSNRHAAHAP